MIPTINIQTLQDWLNDDSVILIDVREPDEFAASSIPGATLFPLSQFNPSTIKQVPGKKIVFQCRSGQRSGRACSIFLSQYPNIEAYNLEGGILAWQAEKLNK